MPVSSAIAPLPAAPGPPSASAPPATVVLPLKVPVPDRIRVPGPVFVRPPGADAEPIGSRPDSCPSPSPPPSRQRAPRPAGLCRPGEDQHAAEEHGIGREQRGNLTMLRNDGAGDGQHDGDQSRGDRISLIAKPWRFWRGRCPTSEESMRCCGLVTPPKGGPYRAPKASVRSNPLPSTNPRIGGWAGIRTERRAQAAKENAERASAFLSTSACRHVC